MKLLSASSKDWLDTVLNDFDQFLVDHAANERKASAMAMSMVAHYPDKPRLLNAMIDLALEELHHFKQVVKVVNQRGLILPADEKDPYVNELRTHIRKGTDPYFLDRLLTAAVIEARGAERFSQIANAVEDNQLQQFYQTLAKSEAGHHKLFLNLADEYFPADEVQSRLSEWLKIEQQVIDKLPARARLH